MNGDIKGPVISSVLGATFFAIPYLGLGISIIPSLCIGFAAFGAGNLLLSNNKNTEKNDNMSLYEMLNEAKKQNAQIYSIIKEIENKSLQLEIKEIYDVSTKIIDTVSKNPKKLSQTQNFFNYYLPVTLKILVKYDTIENQKLDSEESKKFMESTENMIIKIKKSFKAQLSNLYQSDMVDTDAEIKVFESMLNQEGFNDVDDFNIK